MTQLSFRQLSLLRWVCWEVIPPPLSLTPATSYPGPCKALRLSPQMLPGAHLLSPVMRRTQGPATGLIQLSRAHPFRAAYLSPRCPNFLFLPLCSPTPLQGRGLEPQLPGPRSCKNPSRWLVPPFRASLGDPATLAQGGTPPCLPHRKLRSRGEASPLCRGTD